ncbi:MAG: hypothetical protein HY982_02805, partial [Candidatus Magasanikbacteria bacterium]|nr:hypothetical protein [Candidatus Magasanikbacteria bacterium]
MAAPFKKIAIWFREQLKTFNSWRKKPFFLNPIHDRRVVLNLGNGKKIPSPRQLRFLPKFLSSQEKKLIGLLVLLIFISLSSLIAETYFKRLTRVPTAGGEYTEGVIGSPISINPLFSPLNPTDADLVKLIYAGLFRYDSLLNLVPDLAESYTVDKEGKIFTVRLKPNLQWQDGEPITAADAVFTFNSIQNPETQSPLLVSFQGVKVNKVDDFTFTLELPESFAPFSHLLTTGLLPEHLWQEIPQRNLRMSLLNLKPVGAGPFMYESFTKDGKGNIKSYTLKANPLYHQGAPYLKNLVFKFFNDQESAFEALRNHQINGLNFLAKEQKEKLNRKSITINSLRLPYYSALFFNQKNNLLLRSKTLREALELSIDKNQIIAVSLKGEGAIVSEPILPAQVGYTPDFKTAFNPALAQKKLDDDGWKKISREEFLEKRKKELYQAWLDERRAQKSASEKTSAKKLTPVQLEAKKKETEEEKKQAEETWKTIQADMDATETRQKTFRHKNNYGLSVKIVTGNQPELTQTANLIKENWQDLGVQAEIEVLDGAKLREAIKNRSYEVLLYGVLL